MLTEAVLSRANWMECLYLCRAEISIVVDNGIRMSSFNNSIEN